jgi:hypothetical protein
MNRWLHNYENTSNFLNHDNLTQDDIKIIFNDVMKMVKNQVRKVYNISGKEKTNLYFTQN